MGKIHGINLNHTVNGIAFEADTTNVDIEIANKVIEVTAAGSIAKNHLGGIYGWVMMGSYNFNSAAAKNALTLYAALTSGEITVACTPGGGSEGANNPEYTGPAFIQNYHVSIPNDGAITCKAKYQGSGVLTRDIT